MPAGWARHSIVTERKSKTRGYILLEANPVYEKLTGLDVRKALNKRVEGLYKSYLSDSLKLEGIFSQVVETGEDYSRELLLPLTGIWVKLKVFRNEPGHFVIMCEDISVKKKYEERMIRVNRDLQQSNRELEQFAYVASHDLQEPLRMISSYTQLLARKYQGNLDEKADTYIFYATDGARRMQNLINDLLDYSRVSTRGKTPGEIDCHTLLANALLSLRNSIEESGAIITNHELPVIQADASQMERVFVNLIGNAIKFRGSEIPRIHIWAVRNEAEWVFSVRDNGIGIDPKYKDKIFVIFQRLHSSRDYPGTGIGLSICKRIINRHGGKIWFDSGPGQGTTFHFTIPANSNNQAYGESNLIKAGADPSD